MLLSRLRKSRAKLVHSTRDHEAFDNTTFTSSTLVSDFNPVPHHSIKDQLNIFIPDPKKRIKLRNDDPVIMLSWKNWDELVQAIIQGDSSEVLIGLDRLIADEIKNWEQSNWEKNLRMLYNDLINGGFRYVGKLNEVIVRKLSSYLNDHVHTLLPALQENLYNTLGLTSFHLTWIYLVHLLMSRKSNRQLLLSEEKDENVDIVTNILRLCKAIKLGIISTNYFEFMLALCFSIIAQLLRDHSLLPFLVKLIQQEGFFNVVLATTTYLDNLPESKKHDESNSALRYITINTLSLLIVSNDLNSAFRDSSFPERLISYIGWPKHLLNNPLPSDPNAPLIDQSEIAERELIFQLLVLHTLKLTIGKTAKDMKQLDDYGMNEKLLDIILWTTNCFCITDRKPMRLMDSQETPTVKRQTFRSVEDSVSPTPVPVDRERIPQFTILFAMIHHLALNQSEKGLKIQSNHITNYHTNL